MFYKFGRFICRFFLKIFCLLEISGRENIPEKEAVMLAVNHTSFLDPAVIGAASKRILYYFAREDLFKSFFLKKLFEKVNTIPISQKRLDFSVVRKVSKLVENREAFVFFPEGTRSKNGKIQKGHAGVGLMAWKTRVKVLPVLIEGAYEALPLKAKFVRPSKIKVTFGQVVNLNNFYQRHPSRELYQEIVDKIMQSIKELSS